MLVITLPDFHDGFFDGLQITPPKKVHLFLRTHDQHRFTLVLDGIEALKLGNVKEGNIIFEAVLIKPEELAAEHIENAYDLPTGNAREEQLNKLLAFARDRGLLGFELTSSNGAEGMALFRAAEIYPDYQLR
jgi:hypothetical protein